MPASVIIDDLHKRYGQVQAVSGISFAIGPGEIFGLLGPNGAGKTTTIECLLGLREPDSGTIAIAGLDIRTQRRLVQQKIGAVLQNTALPDQITSREALRLFGSFYRQQLDSSVLVKRFALAEFADERYITLSGGQKQRLALALAFVNRPEIIVLDEPTAGLDPQSRHELHDEIRRLKQHGCAVLLSTHNIEEAEQLCDNLAIINRGRIAAIGNPRELIARSNAMQAITLVTAQSLNGARLAQIDEVSELRVDGVTAHFRTSNAVKLLPALAAWCAAEHVELCELHVRKTTLEELFLQLTQMKTIREPSSK